MTDALNDDGTAKDPQAFQQALRGDAGKMKALEDEPETLKIVVGDDMHAFQELIKGVYQVATTPVHLREKQCALVTSFQTYKGL